MYRVIAFVGKSAAGKDSLYREFISAFPSYNPIISCTTRPPREGEVDGINYYFLSSEDFINKIKNNEMLEWTSFNGWYYGSCLTHFKKDAINVGIFNPEGVNSLIEHPDIKVAIIYVHADDITRIFRSLRREKNLNVEEIIRRYYVDEDDFIEYKNFKTFNKNFGDIGLWLSNENDIKVKDLIKIIFNFLQDLNDNWA